MAALLQKAEGDKAAAKLEAVIGDKGYDSQATCRLVYEHYGAVPIIPICERADMQVPDIWNAKGTPLCSGGVEMVYCGRDGNYL